MKNMNVTSVRTSAIPIFGFMMTLIGLSYLPCQAALHPGTVVKYEGSTARIYVPNTWETVGSGYVANAPLEELAALLKLKPSLTKIRVTWNSYPPGDSMAGTALYIRSRGTVEVFTLHASTERTTRSHSLYSRVTDTILHRVARLHSQRPMDGYSVDASAFFNELVNYGCQMRKLS